MAKSLKKVLLVDDDPMLLNAMAAVLSMENEFYGVATAENGSEALELLSREDFFIVVSDINMPGISGLHLLTEIREKYPYIKVILITGFGTHEVRIQAEKIGCLHFLDKPFEYAYLRKLIDEQVDNNSSGFAGTLKQIQLIDLIQMCCQAAMSMAIRVVKGEDKGTVYIENGQIIHATSSDLQGELAFYEILSWQNGSFETLGSVHVSEATIVKNSQYLLMEAARIFDEKADADEAGLLKETGVDQGLLEGEGTIRVLIVDDSPMMCRIIGDILEANEKLSVVGTACNGQEALEKIDELKPDLITLDVNMPVMGGGTALKHIMIKSPCPVIIISNVGSRSHMNIFDFLRLGAVDFIRKPKNLKRDSFEKKQIVDRILLAASADTGRFKRGKSLEKNTEKDSHENITALSNSLVVVNSGAGGYSELIKLVSLLPDDLKTCVVVFQNMPEEFAEPLAGYLYERSHAFVKPVRNKGQMVKQVCYIGTNEMPPQFDTVNGTPAFLAMPDSDEEGLTDRIHRTSGIDEFLNSAAEYFEKRLFLILLSGAEIGRMEGVKNVHRLGGKIIIQQLATSMVSSPLEKVLNENIAAQEAGTEDIVRQISTWMSN